MGRTACTEPQCLYKVALYPYFLLSVQDYPVRTATLFLKPAVVLPKQEVI